MRVGTTEALKWLKTLRPQCIQGPQWVSGSEAAELWGLTDRELREIRRSLEELG